MNTLRRGLSVIVLAWAIWVVAGCGSAQQSAAPGLDTVMISLMKFQPATLYINKWDTVVWINQDMVGHDVTQFPDKTWTSDTIQVGSSWKRVVGEDLDYFCSIHPTMKGKIIIRQ